MSEEVLARIRAVKTAHEKELMKKANVVGVGIGLRRKENRISDEIAIIVSVTRKVHWRTLDPDDIIPTELDGVPVDVQEIGFLQAH